jgi:hypothetical protein
LLQYQVSLLINNIQEVSYVNTLSDHTSSRRCFESPTVVWNPSIIFSFSLAQSMGHLVVMVLREDKKYLGMEDYDAPIFGFPCLVVGGDLGGLC